MWHVSLDAEADVDAGYALLDAGERTRANAFRFDHLRTSYVLAHAALRVLLARYTAIAPAEIALAAGPYGKPELANSHRLRFNLSHSGQVMAAAFTFDSDVGVDIEQMRSVTEMDRIAERYFHRAEAAALEKLDEAERCAAWFRCWVRKEAYVKATGGGLSVGLHSFQVAVSESVESWLISIEGKDGLSGWNCTDLVVSPTYVGALAVKGARAKAVMQFYESAHRLLAG